MIFLVWQECFNVSLFTTGLPLVLSVVSHSSIVSMHVSYVEVMTAFRFPESTEHKFHTINAVTEQVNALCADYPVYR
ncbi:hypothetical protein [Marinomonas ostreistagni]|uniref:Uncharacterized protein n=1 Tax=Marinomonas ostreistagni TaxID=359209 RepID=A0ABS0Z9L9_9GAMM|nr:hypothetical protein [Marinomonas ostreistagni]MBJ7549878.1 hypothetical protein [Marinomonas ostreistagni]